jgi:general secretion pathway protein J
MRMPLAMAVRRFGTCDGFTLIEVLIAASLLSFLAVLLMGGVRFGTRVMESGLQRADHTARMSAAFGFLRNRLAQAQPLAREPDDKGNTPIVFAGEPDSVTFVDVTPPYLAVGGYELLTIDNDHQGGHGRLVVTLRAYHGTAVPSSDAAARKTILFDDAATVAFQYFGSAAPNEPPRWHSTWRAQPGLPSLVRITVDLPDGRTSPELVVALRLGRDAL